MARNLRLEDLWAFTNVSDPQISPDGNQVVYVRTGMDYDENSYRKHLWLWDGEENRQFTHGEGTDTYPRWSPDGSKLLFLSSRGGNGQGKGLWMIPRKGGEARCVAEFEDDITNPAWASDSKRILFLSRVWTRDKPDTDVKRIKRIKYKLNGVGTFEGRRNHIFTVKLGEDPQQLTNGEFDVEQATWSPDCKKIAFTTNMSPDADVSRVRDVYIIPAEGGEPIKTTDGRFSIRSISWSPDGNEIAFIGHDNPEELAKDLDLWLMSPQGEDLRNLTADFDRSLMMGVGSDIRVSTPNPGPVWSNNSEEILFVTADTPYCNVYRVDHDGEVVDLISGKVVDGFSVSEDGEVISFNAMKATHPAELYISHGGTVERISGFNDELLREVEFREPEHFTFTNRLGREVDGWIIKPMDFKEGQSYPTVLEMHGGPRGVYGDAPYHEFQLLASEGYAVIYTNPRGSAGYEEPYTQAVMGHYGEVDYEDFMDFMDEALERFAWIDEDRLGLTGGSYGGYTTNWIITQTDRFKAAVTFRSICNWVSKFGCSDIGYMQPKSISGYETYWEDAIEEQLKHSPIRYVDRVVTPVLIIHSEEDLRCPMEQAEQWFTALKLNGVPTELIRFPDENHELSRSGKPKHREERLQHMLRWFKKYLK